MTGKHILPDFGELPVAGLKPGRVEALLVLAELLAAASCHVPDRPWHALGHTFASHYAMAGGNLLARQKILGHSKFEMTQIYSHLAPDFMAGEIARLSFGSSVSASPPAEHILPLPASVIAQPNRDLSCPGQYAMCRDGGGRGQSR